MLRIVRGQGSGVRSQESGVRTNYRVFYQQLFVASIYVFHITNPLNHLLKKTFGSLQNYLCKKFNRKKAIVFAFIASRSNVRTFLNFATYYLLLAICEAACPASCSGYPLGLATCPSGAERSHVETGLTSFGCKIQRQPLETSTGSPLYLLLATYDLITFIYPNLTFYGYKIWITPFLDIKI